MSFRDSTREVGEILGDSAVSAATLLRSLLAVAAFAGGFRLLQWIFGG